jgi:PPM family protein phosphatase
MKEANCIKYHAITDIGKARANNEDYFLADEMLNLYILADGIGGHNYGEIAAKKACEVVLEKFKQVDALSPISDIETALSVMKFAIYSANRAIYQMALDDKQYKGMGTTVVAFFKFEDKLILGHVGDSRCYKSSGALTQLTDDHTIFVQKSPKSRSFRSKHYLTKSVGLKEFIEPTIQCLDYDDTACYLLCSDGLSDYLEHNKIESILAESTTWTHKKDLLLQSALETPAKDNITFILISPSDEKN